MNKTFDSSAGQASYGELVRSNRNFRLAWFGQIISLTGDWFDLIASASLLGMLTKSPGLAVGGLFVVRMLAPFLVTPLAGVLADRFSRKMLLVVTDALRAVIVLGFLLVRRPEDVWILYTVTALQLGLSGIYFPARNAILPDIVQPREMGAANALSSATWSIMLAVGAALGGFANGLLGVYFCFVLDSLSFILSALLENQIHYQHVPPAGEGRVTISSAFRQYVEGMRFLRHNLDILFISLHKGAVALIITGAFQVIQVALAQNTFVIGQQGGISLGIIYMVVGVGTGIGPIAARWVTGDRNRPLRNAIGLGYLLNAVGMFITIPLSSFGLVLIGTLLRGVGTGIAWVFSSQLLFQLLPNRVRGRVFATEFAFLTLANAIGSAVGGWAIDRVAGGIPTMLGWMGGLILIPAALWALWIIFGRVAETQVSDNSMLIPRTPAERAEMVEK